MLMNTILLLAMCIHKNLHLSLHADKYDEELLNLKETERHSTTSAQTGMQSMHSIRNAQFLINQVCSARLW